VPHLPEQWRRSPPASSSTDLPLASIVLTRGRGRAGGQRGCSRSSARWRRRSSTITVTPEISCRPRRGRIRPPHHAVKLAGLSLLLQPKVPSLTLAARATPSFPRRPSRSRSQSPPPRRSRSRSRSPNRREAARRHDDARPRHRDYGDDRRGGPSRSPAAYHGRRSRSPPGRRYRERSPSPRRGYRSGRSPPRHSRRSPDRRQHESDMYRRGRSPPREDHGPPASSKRWVRPSNAASPNVFCAIQCLPHPFSGTTIAEAKPGKNGTQSGAGFSLTSHPSLK
jgi:hypothetical protein